MRFETDRGSTVSVTTDTVTITTRNPPYQVATNQYEVESIGHVELSIANNRTYLVRIHFINGTTINAGRYTEVFYAATLVAAIMKAVNTYRD